MIWKIFLIYNSYIIVILKNCTKLLKFRHNINEEFKLTWRFFFQLWNQKSTEEIDSKWKSSPPRSRCNANPKGLKERSSLRPGQWSSELRPERIERCRKLERNEAETPAAARGKQTGVGVKAAKKKETKAKEETRNKKRGRSSKGENEGGEDGNGKRLRDGGGFFSFRREPGSPISDRYRYSTRRGKDRCMKLLLPISMLMRETYGRME